MGAKTPSAPPDPSPRPTVVSDTAKEVNEAKRQQQKKVTAQYGRNKTILSGSDTGSDQSKKTILGG